MRRLAKKIAKAYAEKVIAIHKHEQSFGGVAKRQDGLSWLDDDLDDDLDEDAQLEVFVAYDRMSRQLSATNRSALKVQGIAIDLRAEHRVNATIQAARQKNVVLVAKANRAYAQSVREIFDDPESYGLSVRELTQKLLEKGDVWASRAELIARDQTLKLNSAVTKDRHQSAGISQYTWSTSLDDRVRPEHAELEGTVQSWDVPPDPGHPGEDFQCRCVAIPIVPDLTEEDPSDEEA